MATPNAGNDGTITKEQLIRDFKRLFHFAMENGRVPIQINTEEIYDVCCKAQADITVEDVAKVAQSYEILCRELVPVTAKTLRDTDQATISGKRFKERRVGKYLMRMRQLVYGLIFLILCINFLEFYNDVNAESLNPGDAVSNLNNWLFYLHKLAGFIIPFAYGTLGACAYILKVSELHLKDRSFRSSRIPEHKNRLVLGTLSGGVIVLFVNELPGHTAGTVSVVEAALGFIAGYSIDMLFEVVDRMIKAILPRVGLDTKELAKQKQREQSIAGRIEERVKKLGDDAKKDMFADIIEDLRKK